MLQEIAGAIGRCRIRFHKVILHRFQFSLERAMHGDYQRVLQRKAGSLGPRLADQNPRRSQHKRSGLSIGNLYRTLHAEEEMLLFMYLPDDQAILRLPQPSE